MLSLIKQRFQNYTTQFYTDDQEYNRNILLKADHCIRTAKTAGDIALREGFPSAEQELARMIGLLHDIGRFEQYRQFRTFADHHSIDHGVLGETIALESALLDGIPPEARDIIAKSIRYHNRLSLPDDENALIIRFAQLARDADKIDIFRLSCDYFKNRTEKNKNHTLEMGLDAHEGISDDVSERILSGQSALMNTMRTITDFKALEMSWIFDINYKSAFRIIAERQVLERLYSTMPTENIQVQGIYHRVRQFLNQQLELPNCQCSVS